MGRNDIPERWEPYSPMGSVTPGTRFIACKVPLKEVLLRRLPKHERFGPSDLMEAFPKMGLLVDLTNTTRYYLKEEFTDKNVRYEKIFCPGKVVPPNSIIKQFFDVVDDYLATEEDPDAVIAVHCTHGVNRTGYFICRYMIERLNMSPEEALKNFQSSRGHSIERDSYVSDLKNGCKGGNESDLCFVQNKNVRGRKDSSQQMSRSTRGYGSREADRNHEVSTKRYRYDYSQKPDGYYRSKKWGYNSSEGQRMSEGKDKLSINWRDHGKNENPHLQSTMPHSYNSHMLPSSRHQENRNRSSLNSFQAPKPPHLQESPRFPSYDDTSPSNRGNFKGHPPKCFRGPPRRGFRGSSHQGFSPLPKFCHPESFNESDAPSRLTEDSISNPKNSLYGPARYQTSTSSFSGNSRARISSRGRGRGRGTFHRGGSSRDRGRGRGTFHRGGSSGQINEKEPQWSGISR